MWLTSPEFSLGPAHRRAAENSSAALVKATINDVLDALGERDEAFAVDVDSGKRDPRLSAQLLCVARNRPSPSEQLQNRAYKSTHRQPVTPVPHAVAVKETSEEVESRGRRQAREQASPICIAA